MIKTIVSIERMMNKDSEMEKFSFEALLIKRPAEKEMNYAQLVRFAFVLSLLLTLLFITKLLTSSLIVELVEW